MGPDYMRRVAMLSYDILRVRDTGEVWNRPAESVAALLQTTAVRGFDLDAGLDTPVVEVGSTNVTRAARDLEAALIPLALEAGRSLISNHPALDPRLHHLARNLEAEGTILHALLLRADARTHGVVTAHWSGAPRPGYERRAGFYLYAENAALAMAIARERADLHRTAFVDALTGFPTNAHSRPRSTATSTPIPSACSCSTSTGCVRPTRHSKTTTPAEATS
ncbi:MAG TPA: hypothetical protein VHS27_04515 [Gaiellales bacterium]|nr:hypothetical protein [Gaiellales bacterium]